MEPIDQELTYYKARLTAKYKLRQELYDKQLKEREKFNTELETIMHKVMKLQQLKQNGITKVETESYRM